MPHQVVEVQISSEFRNPNNRSQRRNIICNRIFLAVKARAMPHQQSRRRIFFNVWSLNWPLIFLFALDQQHVRWRIISSVMIRNRSSQRTKCIRKRIVRQSSTKLLQVNHRINPIVNVRISSLRVNPSLQLRHDRSRTNSNRISSAQEMMNRTNVNQVLGKVFEVGDQTHLFPDGYRPSIAISLYSPLRKWTGIFQRCAPPPFSLPFASKYTDGRTVLFRSECITQWVFSPIFRSSPFALNSSRSWANRFVACTSNPCVNRDRFDQNQWTLLFRYLDVISSFRHLIV